MSRRCAEDLGGQMRNNEMDLTNVLRNTVMVSSLVFFVVKTAGEVTAMAARRRAKQYYRGLSVTNLPRGRQP